MKITDGLCVSHAINTLKHAASGPCKANLALSVIYFLTKEISMTTLQKIRQFFRSEEGVTAIEYALIAALIAAAIIAGVSLLGTNVSTEFSSIAGVV